MMTVLSKKVILLAIFTSIVTASQTKYPVVIVPGDGGSRLEARINKPSVPHVWCKKTTDWFLLWFNIQILLPFTNDCFFDNLNLIYDPITHTTQNMPGVETRLSDFGNTSGVERLDSGEFRGIIDEGNYFGTIVDYLVDKLNYTRGISVRAAPYDFRKGPNEMSDYLENLKKLIEDSYMKNDDRRVVLVSHSMGSLYVLYMLNQQSQTWKDKYIQSFISIAAPWGGVAKAVHAIATGDNLGLWFVKSKQARREQRSMPSTIWMLPSDEFWGSNEVLISTPNSNYTARDYQSLFNDINYPIGYMMWQDTVDLIHELPAPGVEVHCLHGSGIDTPLSFVYNDPTAKWYNTKPEMINGDGDGTVNLRSLQGCRRWFGLQEQKVQHKAFQMAEHKYIVHKPEVLKYISWVLSQ